jgi:hypothetical protein
MTAVSGSVYTAAQFNTFVRDNLNETAPAKATTAGGYFVTSSLNEIMERIGVNDTILTSETTSSTSYTDLATIGPTVTTTTSNRALILWSGVITNNTADVTSRIGVEVSGASSIPAADTAALIYDPPTPAGVMSAAQVLFAEGLTPGSNTFTLKYKVGSGASIGTFFNRRVIVLPY